MTDLLDSLCLRQWVWILIQEHSPSYAVSRLPKICIACLFSERLKPILGMFWTAAWQQSRFHCMLVTNIPICQPQRPKSASSTCLCAHRFPSRIFSTLVGLVQRLSTALSALQNHLSSFQKFQSIKSFLTLKQSHHHKIGSTFTSAVLRRACCCQQQLLHWQTGKCPVLQFFSKTLNTK